MSNKTFTAEFTKGSEIKSRINIQAKDRQDAFRVTFDLLKKEDYRYLANYKLRIL